MIELSFRWVEHDGTALTVLRRDCDVALPELVPLVAC